MACESRSLFQNTENLTRMSDKGIKVLLGSCHFYSQYSVR